METLTSLRAPTRELDGRALLACLASGAAQLERHVAEVNALNVFPVPDGDTGINMLSTIRSALDTAGQADDFSLFVVARRISEGALLGARGNSGVILSQILAGFAQRFANTLSVTPTGLAEALTEASNQAWLAVPNPVEGTILSVARDAAAGIGDTQDVSLEEVMSAALNAANAAVERTPDQLAILKDAGVVDAGGRGLALIFDGMHRHLIDEPVTRPAAGEAGDAVTMEFANAENLEAHPYGYCTEFLLTGQHVSSIAAIRERMIQYGESVLVVGNEDLVRVHVHTFDPGAALTFATGLGSLRQIKVENMQDQFDRFKSAHPVDSDPPAALQVIAVAHGYGFVRLFQSLGAQVASCGPTLNPSTGELLEAIKNSGAQSVIILPNNKNVVETARQAARECGLDARVIPTTSLVGGVTAAFAFRPDDDIETNLDLMTSSLDEVMAIEVTKATRDSQWDGSAIAEGQYLAFLDGELRGVSESIPAAVNEALESAPRTPELFTVYYGIDTGRTTAELVAESLAQAVPGAEVELIQGGQPNYHFIISAE